MEDDWSCGSLNDEITRCWNRQMYLKIIINTESTVDCSILIVKRMFAKTLATNWFAKDCVCWSLIKSLETETEKLATLRSCSFIYTGRAGKFPFVFVWRLPVAATLFYLELIYYYIKYILTMLVLRDKITTWLELSSGSYEATILSN